MFNALEVFQRWCMSLENNVNSVLKLLLVQRNWSPFSMQHLSGIQNCWIFRKNETLSRRPFSQHFFLRRISFLASPFFFLIVSHCVALNISLRFFNWSGRNPKSLGHLCNLEKLKGSSFCDGIVALGCIKVTALASLWSKRVAFLKVSQWPVGFADNSAGCKQNVRGFCWLDVLLKEFNC